APGPLLGAHRGWGACFPENTLAAFAAGLNRCGMIELNVRLSRDGAAVVFHEQLSIRTSDAALAAAELGLTSLAVAVWLLDQLRWLDAGSWFLRSDPSIRSRAASPIKGIARIPVPAYPDLAGNP
ncbi:MAG: hypothetical protein FWF31_09195, partial [Desulfobulbus sp.]|nr:hypothetical protein [Desulfobulbus sp.]